MRDGAWSCKKVVRLAATRKIHFAVGADILKRQGLETTFFITLFLFSNFLN